MINKFNRKFNRKNKEYDKEVFGLFLSALMQSSYKQGFNDFKFENINANCFGGWLRGKEGKPIIVKAEKINGDYTLSHAKNCVAEINNYQGDYFGYKMNNCTIYSPNQESLDVIKRQITQGWWGFANNSFHLKEDNFDFLHPKRNKFELKK
ncbi:hypothetical protein HY643_03440 [Candidatus Woesearchaeota archaeon]|nr:hypothetical protein [Candidatus Woesearchaeota archaeon]